MSNLEKAIFTVSGRISQVRWIMYLKDGRKVVENLGHDRGWRQQYREHYGNIERLGVQILPQNIRFELEATKDMYWTYEGMSVNLAGGAPKHDTRSICAKGNRGWWDVLTIDLETGIVSQKNARQKEIGYEEKVKGKS